MNDRLPRSVLSKELLPASIAIYTMVALAAFESLAVAAALPDIAADLGRVDLLPWVITGYLLLSGVGAVVAGPLVDSVGVKAMFRTAVVVFVGGSVVAAFATSMPQMVAARVLQGAGGGLLLAVGLAAVNLLYPPHLIGRAFAANSSVWGVMGVAGPGIAAVMLSLWTWPWIFLVNVPLGGVALAVGWRVMPGPVGADRGSFRLDGRGILLVLLFNSLLLLGVDSLSPLSGLWLAGAATMFALYVRHARRRPEPVMKIRHLLEPPYGVLALSVAMLLVGGLAVHAFFTLYVRGARGAGAALTAWSVMFFVVGWTVGANLSSRLMDRRAESSVMIAGFVTTLAALVSVAAAAGLTAPLPVLFVAMFGAGSGIGLATNAGLTLLRAVTPSEQIGRATAAHQFYRNLGFAAGAAVGGAVILLVVGRRLGDVEVVRELLAGVGSSTGDDVAAAIASGFTGAALVGAAFAAGGLGPLVRLRRFLAPARAVADRDRSGA